MKVTFPDELVLYDLEYTAWEGSQERKWSGPNEYREIIQIGAIRVSPDLVERDSFLEYVRPVKNPQLSDFITELTGISQDDIDTKGISFSTAFEKFRAFVGETTSYCWGRDTEILEENTGFAGVPQSLPRCQFADLRPIAREAFSDAGVDIDDYSSGTLIQAFGIDSGRRAHDAINDMRNLLDAIKIVNGRAT